tara:strand:+ start:538 stop:834 length:297 start_codon:yes stop_codon:yes gene_type:complete
MNIPAQLVIGSYIFNNLLVKEQKKFKFYKEYKSLNNSEWLGDNYFYDETDLLTFWGVNDSAEICGSVYVREFDNFTRDDERLWKSLSLNGSQIKIYWC